MKFYQVVFLLFPFLLQGQTCDTLFSHDNYVKRKVKIGYRDCYSVKVDTVYQIIQWKGEDSNYLKPLLSDNMCYSLFHSRTGNLIKERWQIGDTIYFKSYYESGKTRTISKTAVIEEPHYFHEIKREFWENGKIQYEADFKSSSTTINKKYYENGNLESLANSYNYMPGAFGEYVEYFPNGQKSMVLHFAQPDTTHYRYQYAELLDSTYYNENGEIVDHDLNEYNEIEIPVYPPNKSKTLVIDDTLFTHFQFENQDGYANDMMRLKKKILKNIKLPKSCQCRKGLVMIGLIITKEGELKIHELEFGNESVKQSIQQSISKIKHWMPAVLDGKKVDTYVYTHLVLDI